jgi:DNA repair exonuclease SbcCD nuclease subunit
MFADVFDSTFMGHIHKPQVLRKDPLVCHVGSLDISDFGEVNHEKIICLYDSNKGVINIPVPTRNLRKIDVCIPSTEDPTKYLLDIISQEENNKSIFDSILKIEIKFEDPNHKINNSLVTQELQKLSVHNLVGIIESRASSAVSVEKKNALTVNVEPVPAFKDWLSAQPVSEDRHSDILEIAKSIIEEASK